MEGAKHSEQSALLFSGPYSYPARVLFANDHFLHMDDQGTRDKGKAR